MGKRLLKQEIKNSVDSTLTDCLFCAYLSDADVAAKFEDLTIELIDLEAEMIERMNAFIAKGEQKAYYKQLKTDFSTKMTAIIDKISSLVQPNK